MITHGTIGVTIAITQGHTTATHLTILMHLSILIHPSTVTGAITTTGTPTTIRIAQGLSW